MRVIKRYKFIKDKNMDLMFWCWILVLAIAIIVEVTVQKMIAVWFIPAAISACALSLCYIPWYYQLLLCLVVAFLGIFFGNRLIKRIIGKEGSSVKLEDLVGKRCTVYEKIDNYAGCGLVDIGGQIWSARGIDEDSIFERGEVLSVIAIEGVKLICDRS
jgi:membrane protein implicated in regulation of membrane protease activity